MPIHVTIKVNDREVKTLHIARVEGGLDREAGKEHGYRVLEQKNEPQNEGDWDAGVPFTHVYGDGLTVCVQKALESLNSVE